MNRRMGPDLSITEVAEKVRLSPSLVARMARSGFFPNAYKAGTGGRTSPVRIPEADVDRYLKTRPKVSR